MKMKIIIQKQKMMTMNANVDVVITITDTDLTQTYHIDQDIVKAYKEQIEAISTQLGIAVTRHGTNHKT